MNRVEAFNCLRSSGLSEEQIIAIEQALIPEPKTGHWQSSANKILGAWRCSECHMLTDYKSRYCAGCGAEMGGKR